MTATKNERAYVLDANEQQQNWLRENPHGMSEEQQLALTWYRHMMMYRDSDEGANLIEQSYPQYNIPKTYEDNFGR